MPQHRGVRSRKTAAGLSDERRERFVEELGSLWADQGYSRMQARILAYLMLSNEPHCSSAELATALRASTGSISTATRLMVEAGWIRRVFLPGERGHYFRAEDDVWGAFLAGERPYLRRAVRYAEDVLAGLGSVDETPRRRLSNMRDYMTWVEQYHRRMLSDWEEYKRKRDARGR